MAIPYKKVMAGGAGMELESLNYSAANALAARRSLPCCNGRLFASGEWQLMCRGKTGRQLQAGMEVSMRTIVIITISARHECKARHGRADDNARVITTLHCKAGKAQGAAIAISRPTYRRRPHGPLQVVGNPGNQFGM